MYLPINQTFIRGSPSENAQHKGAPKIKQQEFSLEYTIISCKKG